MIDDPLFREYSVTDDVLKANRALMTAFRENRAVRLDTVTWFIPYFPHIYRGGIHTIMRFANHFSERAGTLNRFVFYGNPKRSLKALDDDIGAAFPPMHREVLALDPGADENSLPPSDIGICTLWNSAYHLLRYNRCKGKFYFVQDFEPGFYPAGSIYGLIELTYRFGFEGIVNTFGVWECYRMYGNGAEYFTPGVDHSIFFPSPDKALRVPLRVVFYGRPSKSRNGFELGLSSLKSIKAYFKDRIEIVSVGEEFSEADYGVQGIIKNLGVLPSLQKVAELYRKCHVGLVLMFTKHPSYQPLEYMASGCATVSNFNESNLWLFRDRENCMLAQPTVNSLSESLVDILENEALREKVIQGGMTTVRVLRWGDALERVYCFVTTGETQNHGVENTGERFGRIPLQANSNGASQEIPALAAWEEKNGDEEVRRLEHLLEQKTDELTRVVKAYQNSLSWRITAPLRSIYSRMVALKENYFHSKKGDTQGGGSLQGREGTVSFPGNHNSPDPRKNIIEQFHFLYYNSKVTTWGNTFWLGVPTMKCPMDFWIYQEIIYDLRPEVIIECGTYKGGGALFLASICDLIDEGMVISIDIKDWGKKPEHNRIRYLLGSSISDEIREAITRFTKGKDRVMVVLDSDHSKDYVLRELRLYGQFVTKGSYLILEDTNINGHPVRPEFGPGPMEALNEFLQENDGFIVDADKEKFYLTMNPQGYLRKIR